MPIMNPNGRALKYPDNCTKCGKSLVGEGGFPLPEKQFLCKDCFMPALSSGLEKINGKLRKA